MATDTRLLVDTNIILDYCDFNRKEHADAVRLVEYAAGGAAELLVLVSSLKDVYYVLRRLYADEATAREAIRLISRDAFTPVDLVVAYSAASLESNEPDYEDGLVRAAAEALRVQAIVTRDDKAFTRSFIPSMNAAETLERLGADS